MCIFLCSLAACRKDDPAPSTGTNPPPDSTGTAQLPCEKDASRIAWKYSVSYGIEDSVTYDENGLPPTYRRAGTDSLIETPSAARTNIYIFDKAGDQVRTIQLFHIISTDSVRRAEFRYTYDSDHRLIFRTTHVMTDTVRLQDSVAMIWESGNLIEERPLGAGTGYKYEYDGNGKGRNPENMPFQSSRWMYLRGTVTVASRDYVTKINGVGVALKFDGKGRLTQRDAMMEPVSYSAKYRYVCR